MTEEVRTFLIKNGLFLFFTTLKFAYPAPIYISKLTSNFSIGTTNLTLFENKTEISNIFLLRETHISEVSWLNITDGQSFQQKQLVVNYLSAIEDSEEKKQNLTSSKSTTKPIPYVFEEDIILTPHQAQIIYESRNPRQKRKLNTDLLRHWQLPIQYAFDGSHNDSQRTIIKSALHYWESCTCINFTEIAYKDNNSINDNHVYIVFTSNEGCWSFVGRSTYREQKVSINEDCMYEGHVLHEIGHVIGYWHEHARPDRDEYITVQQNAIQLGKQYNFLHISYKDLDTKDLPYDVSSIMHYGSMAYAKDTTSPVQPTILTKDPLLQRALGQRFQLSYYDIKLANMAYCTNICNKSQLAQPCQHDGYQDPKQCSRCRCPEGLSGDYCETVASSVGYTCGGVMNVTGTPSTFGFPWAYQFGQHCNWYIKAPKDNRIFFALESTRVMDYNDCSTDPYIECLNYIEVRYSHNIAKAGARICCSYLPTAKPIISEGNEMLVLMKANGYGSFGFQAKVWAEPCGGCLSGTEQTHQPCSRRISYVCQHKWNYTIWNPCPSGNWWWADNKDCNQLVTKTAFRSGICFRSELFCCHGYQLNGSTCIKSTTMTTTNVVIHSNQSSTQYLVPTQNPSGGKENDPVTGWGNWTSWSNCSRPCGGCGNQTRQRLCYDPLLCSGKSVEVETRTCNLHPCFNTNIGTRNKAVVKVCYTNPITLQLTKCTVYEKETYTYVTETCCVGFSKSTNGECVKDTT